MFATNWAQLFLIIAATCALPSLVVGYVGVLRPALARGKGRQMDVEWGNDGRISEFNVGQADTPRTKFLGTPARSPVPTKTER